MLDESAFKVVAGNLTIKPHPMRDLLLVDRDGTLALDPQPDVTPMEAVRLSALFAMVACNGGDWREYVERHALLRHFEKRP